MGEPDAARVDLAVLMGVARQYDVAAEIVDSAVRAQLVGLTFDGGLAGRMHAARGDAVRNAVDELADQARQWARAVAEIASALRASADRYVDADARAARRLR